MMSSLTASGSATVLLLPIREESRAVASASVSTASSSWPAPSEAISPASQDWLVTRTRQPAEPGSSGRARPGWEFLAQDSLVGGD